MVLAQAQECIFIKAEKGMKILLIVKFALPLIFLNRRLLLDNMKPSIIAKLANQAAVLYSEALTAINLPSLKPYLPKDWFNAISSKAINMEIYSEYYAALAAESEQNFGEQIARLNVRHSPFDHELIIREFQG